MVAHCVEEMFSVSVVYSLFNILGSHVLKFVFPVFDGRSAEKDQPFCRTLWSVECLTGRAEFTSVCCGDAHWRM